MMFFDVEVASCMLQREDGWLDKSFVDVGHGYTYFKITLIRDDDDAVPTMLHTIGSASCDDATVNT
jgi:hypothetical protein